MLGKEFMMRQELIDAAEASGLSTMPIEYELVHSCAICAILLLELCNWLRFRVSSQ